MNRGGGKLNVEKFIRLAGVGVCMYRCGHVQCYDLGTK